MRCLQVELPEAMRVRLTTVIWGSDFVDTFLRLTLRSLLAPGNVPALSAFCETGYTIFTTEEDRRLMEAAPLFGELRQHLDLRIVTFTTREIDASHFGSHSDLWVRGLDLARRNQEVLFFIIPDIIYADGTLMRWAKRLQEGFRAIYSPGPQVVLETIYEEFAQRFPSQDQPIALDEVQMRELLLRHLHPIPITMDRTSARRTGHAEYDLRAVPGRGLVIRVLSSHPFCVDPSFFNELRSFNPCDHLDRLAFEDVTVASAEPLLKHVSWYYRPNRLGSADLTQLGFWWSAFSPPACVKESGHVYDIPLREDAPWREQRAVAVAAGAFLRTQLAAASLLARLFLGLAQQGFPNAAGFLAAASLVAVIRRRLVLTGEETLLVPCDGAFGGEAGAAAWRLIEERDFKGIAALLRAHVVRFEDDGSAFTLAGKPIRELAQDTKVLDGPKMIAGFRVLAINRILPPDRNGTAIPRPRRATQQIAPATPGQVTLPGLWDAARHDAPTHSFAPRSPALSLEFEALPPRRRPERPMRHLSARARKVASRAAWRLLDRNRNLLRRTVLFFSGISWARGVAAAAEQTIAYAYRHGLRATYVRIRVELNGRVPTKVGPNRDAALLTDTAVPNYDRATIEDIDPGAPLEELEATAVTAAQMPADPATPALIDNKPDEQIEKALRAVRLVRGLEAVEEILGSYETQILRGLSSSAPLALVRTLRRNWCGDGVNARFVAETALRDALKVHPDDPEILTELGYLLRDAGRFDEAVAVLSASASSNSRVGSAADARAKAATELGEIYSEQGKCEEAVAAFERAISMAPVTSATRYQHGEALRKLGRIRDAVDAFARAMTASHPTWVFPKAGRDARLITVDFHATRPRNS
jgi:hypothetical protein